MWRRVNESGTGFRPDDKGTVGNLNSTTGTASPKLAEEGHGSVLGTGRMTCTQDLTTLNQALMAAFVGQGDVRAL